MSDISVISQACKKHYILNEECAVCTGEEQEGYKIDQVVSAGEPFELVAELEDLQIEGNVTHRVIGVKEIFPIGTKTTSTA